MTKLGVMGRLVALMLLMWVVACTADSSTATSGRQRATPATLKMAAARSRQKAPGYDFVPDAGGTLHALAGDAGAAAAVVTTGRGVRLSRRHGDAFELGVETASVGRDGTRRGRGVVRERAEGQELVIEREDEVEERLLAGPMGVEHSFEVRQRPEGEGPLVLEVAFEGLVPEARGAGDQVLLRDHAGRVRAGYGDLLAADAEGRELEARMQVRGEVVALLIDDAKAAYPVRVDPLVWVQTAELTGGRPLAVAVDGSTAIVSWGPASPYGPSSGTVDVFVPSGASWTQQAELTPSDGAKDAGFGQSVAVSGDIAIVGASGSYYQGAAYVFEHSGTSWTQQTELTPNYDAGLEFGESVAVSGNSAIVSAPVSGAAYVFVHDGTRWTRQTELTASASDAGYFFAGSVALSGNTAIVGAEGDFSGLGAAYIFVHSGTSWTQQAALSPTGSGAGYSLFGSSVGVSGDIAIVGAGYGQGAAFIFEQEQCEAGTCSPVPDAGFDGGVTADGGKTLEAGLDSGAPRDAASDSGTARDATADSGIKHDAARDSTTPHDAGRDSGTTRDATLATDSGRPLDAGTGKDAGLHDASTDATKKAKDASLSATAGLYVSGPVGCGCRTTKDNETGASPAWLAFGAIGLIGRRRMGRATSTRGGRPEAR